VCRVDHLTFGQVSELLAARPSVILPLGGCEPFGDIGPIGIETLCVERIAAEVSTKCDILVAPTLPFGCSTPFISFPGAAGLKPRTFTNMLFEIMHAYVLQGTKNIFLISAAPFNEAPALEAVGRINKKYNGINAVLFDINTIIRTNVDHNTDRADMALLSMAAYLEPANINTSGININRKSVTPDQYRTWKKRGADPQKLRKLFPDGLLQDLSTTEITPERGKEIFDRVVESIARLIGTHP